VLDLARATYMPLDLHVIARDRGLWSNLGDEVGGGVSSVMLEVTDGRIRHVGGYRCWAAAPGGTVEDDPLLTVLRERARQMLTHAIEAEVAASL
jgi:hypothetical protein